MKIFKKPIVPILGILTIVLVFGVVVVILYLKSSFKLNDYCRRKADGVVENKWNTLLEPTEEERRRFGIEKIAWGFREQLDCEKDVLEPAPQLFPINNPQAEYIIEKTDNNVFTISYKDVQQDIKGVMIGNSPIDLAPYVGKKVQIQGKFKNRKNTQCIVDQCQYIYGPYVALDITSIQEK